MATTSEKKYECITHSTFAQGRKSALFPFKYACRGVFEGAQWFIIQPRCAVDVQIYCAGLILKSLFYIIYTRARRQRESPGKNREKSRAAGMLKDGPVNVSCGTPSLLSPFSVCVCLPFRQVEGVLRYLCNLYTRLWCCVVVELYRNWASSPFVAREESVRRK